MAGFVGWGGVGWCVCGVWGVVCGVWRVWGVGCGVCGVVWGGLGWGRGDVLCEAFSLKGASSLSLFFGGLMPDKGTGSFRMPSHRSPRDMLKIWVSSLGTMVADSCLGSKKNKHVKEATRSKANKDLHSCRKGAKRYG